MEKGVNLFSLRIIDNFPIWDILRYRVLSKINVYNTQVLHRTKNIVSI